MIFYVSIKLERLPDIRYPAYDILRTPKESDCSICVFSNSLK